MSRQINLFNPALIKRRDEVNARLLAGLSLAALLLILAVFGYTQYQVTELARQQTLVAEQLKASQTRLVEATQKFVPHQPSATLRDEIAGLEGRLEMHQQVLDYLQQDKFGSHDGFSGYMRALARKNISALWLTGFTIDHDSREMILHGRSLQPELVSQYIAQLGSDPAFHGRTFTAFNLGLPKEAKTELAAVPATQFIEFELKSVREPEEKPPVDGKKS